jgi:hypothetical protein
VFFQFGRVQLNIANSVLPLDKLANTPSSLDGMSAEVRQNCIFLSSRLDPE